MLFVLFIAVYTVFTTVAAAPISSVQVSQLWSGLGYGWPSGSDGQPDVKHGVGWTDLDILHYALTLEHVEAAFYRQGLLNYTHADFINAGFPDPFWDDLKQIAAHESEHVKFLSETLTSLKAPVSAECNYTFPSTDAASFVALANILEGVGVSAYIGVARNVSNKDILQAASSIATVEARHSGYLRKSLETSPFPSAYDVPLFPDEVHTIAHVFLASCPASNPTFPIKAFPALAAVPATVGQPVKEGTMLTLTPSVKLSASGTYGAFITAKGPVWLNLTPTKHGAFTCRVPRGVVGQSYVLLNKGNKAVTDQSILAGPTFIEVSA